MTTERAIADFIGWTARIVRELARAGPIATLATLGFLVARRVTSILAFFLPLKIIILAASEGVPSYFQGFMAPEDKNAYIVGFFLLAIACVILTQILDKAAERVAGTAAGDVLARANALHLIKDQQIEARNSLIRLLTIYADVIFVAVAAGAGLALNWPMYLTAIGLTLLLVRLTSMALANADPIRPTRLQRMIRDNTGNYIGVCSSSIFLGSFTVLLQQFLTGQLNNPILAMLSIIVMRQITSVGGSTLRFGLGLERQRGRLEALMFPRVYIEGAPRGRTDVVQRLLSPGERERLVATAFHRAGETERTPSLRWLDDRLSATARIAITAGDGDEHATRRYLLQAFHAGQRKHLDNEAVLFEHLDRAALAAPALLTRFENGPLECALYDRGRGETVGRDDWPGVYWSLLQRHWACAPGDRLVRSFHASMPLLEDRLDRPLVEQVTVALDTPEEQRVYEHFLTALPAIQAAIASAPRYIHNPELNPRNVVADRSGGWLVMSWGGWSIEPVGAHLPEAVDNATLASALDDLRRQRSDVPHDYGAGAVRLVRRCSVVVPRLRQSAYKSALELMDLILRHDLATRQSSNKRTAVNVPGAATGS